MISFSSHQDPNRGGVGTKLLLFLLVLAGVAALLWVWLLPGLVVSKLQERTGFVVKIDSLSANPFTSNLAIKGLIMKNPPGWPSEDFVDLREFHANANLFSLFSDRLVVNELVIDIAQVSLVRNAEGSLNADLFRQGLAGPATNAEAPKGSPQPKPAGNRAFLIKHMVLKFDKLVYADYTGGSPLVKTYSVNLQQELHDVDSMQKLLAPFQNAALGVVTDTLNDLLNNPNGLKGLSGKLKDAGRKTGEKLKGLLDSLDKHKP